MTTLFETNLQRPYNIKEDFGIPGTYAIDPREIKGPSAFSGGKVFGTRELSSKDNSTCNCNCATSIDSLDVVKSDVNEIKLRLAQLADMLQSAASQQQQTSQQSTQAPSGLGNSTIATPPTTPDYSSQQSQPQQQNATPQ